MGIPVRRQSLADSSSQRGRCQAPLAVQRPLPAYPAHAPGTGPCTGQVGHTGPEARNKSKRQSCRAQQDRLWIRWRGLRLWNVGLHLLHAMGRCLQPASHSLPTLLFLKHAKGGAASLTRPWQCAARATNKSARSQAALRKMRVASSSAFAVRKCHLTCAPSAQSWAGRIGRWTLGPLGSCRETCRE
mgnify:CR=1 FL=1